jgi:hypothetical protein
VDALRIRDVIQYAHCGGNTAQYHVPPTPARMSKANLMQSQASNDSMRRKGKKTAGKHTEVPAIRSDDLVELWRNVMPFSVRARAPQQAPAHCSPKHTLSSHMRWCPSLVRAMTSARMIRLRQLIPTSPRRGRDVVSRLRAVSDEPRSCKI